MTAVFLPWLKFAFCAFLIGYAGPVLTRYAGVIAQLTGLSRSWVGLALLATATSLPELFTGISAVVFVDSPDMAVGDALGSCIFNLSMLVILDALSPDEPLFRRVDQSHVLTAAFGVIMIGSVGAVLLVSRGDLDYRIGHVSVFSPAFIVLYLILMRAAYSYGERLKPGANGVAADAEVTLRTAVLRYLLAAIVVVSAGSWLPFIGLEIAEVMGWKETFVGTLFLAAATSLPEAVVTISALRLGAADMAIANLLGSNLFDVLVIAIDDFAYTKGSLLASVSPVHALTAFAAVVMSGILIVALTFQPRTRFLGTTVWFSLSLLTVYVLSTYAMYLFGH